MNTAQTSWAVGPTVLTASAQRQIIVAAYTIGPDLGLTKVGPSQVMPVGAVVWKLFVTNAGPQPASGVQVVDTVPAGVTGISAQCVVLTIGTCGAAVVGVSGPGGTPVTVTLTNLPVGGQIEVTVRGTAPAAAGALLNQAQVFVAGLVDPSPFNNFASATTQVIAGAPNSGALSGHLWLDANHDRLRDAGELPLAGFMVRAYDAIGTTLVAQSTTDGTGAYSIAGLPAGVSYQIEFRDASGNVVFGLPVTSESGGTGFAATTGCSQWPGTSPPSVVSPNPAGTCYSLTNGGSTAQVQSDGRVLVALQPGDNLVEQGLPFDPGGVVYDSTTRQPIAGATVTVGGPAGFNPATQLLGGASNASQVTGANGFYRFIFIGNAPAGVYTLTVTPPANYTFPSAQIPPSATLDPTGLGFAGVFPVQTQSTPPTGAQPTTYHLGFDFAIGDPDVINNHIPLDSSVTGGGLVLQKIASTSVAAVGDFVQYQLSLSNPGAASVPGVVVSDSLPPGFRYRAGTTRINNVPAPNPVTAPDGRTLTFNIGAVAASATFEIRYVVEVAAGTAVGDALNTAQASGAGGLVRSLVAQATVTVQEDLFKSRTVLLGRVIEVGAAPAEVVAAGQVPTAAQCGPEQLFGKGVEGALVYLEDGTYVRTDKDGKWHVDGVRPGTHVVQLDVNSLPEGYEPVLCENNSRHAGRAYSQFVNVQGGTVWRADFYVRKTGTRVSENEVEHRLSAAPLAAGVRLRLELKGATSTVKNITETFILPKELEYQPGSVRINDLAGPDPQVSENALTFRLGDASGQWRISIEFEARGLLSREMQVKASGQFQSAVGDTHRLPVVGVELPQTQPATLTDAIPVAPAVTPAAPLVERVTLANDTQFVFGSAEFDPAGLEALKGLAERIRGMDRLSKVRVTGHADHLSRSGPDFNTRLSEARARRVAEFLVGQGVDAKLIESSGAGDLLPLIECPGLRSGKLIACLAPNRRVEIEIVQLPPATTSAPSATPVAPVAPATPAAPAPPAMLEALPSGSSVRYLHTDAGHRVEATAVKPAAEQAKPGVLNIYAPGSEQFDANWLANAKPGFEIVYPPADFLPNINSIKIYVKHDPAHTLTVSVNGVPVHKLNFDGSDENAARTIAISRWGGAGLQDGTNKIVVLATDAAGQEVGRAERLLHYAGSAVEGRLVPEASTLVADGRTGPVIAVRIYDRDGKPARHGTDGPLQITAPYQLLEVAQRQDSRPLLDDIGNVGKWRVTEDGLALIRLQPTMTSGEVVLTFNFPGKPPQMVRAWLRPELRDWILVGFAEGTVGHSKLSGNLENLPSSAGDEDLWKDGRVAFYAKGRVKGDFLLTIAYDTDKEERRTTGNAGARLNQTIDRKQYYTIYGDTTSPQYDAASVRNLYLKIEKNQFYALFGDFDTGMSMTELSRYSRTVNGVKSEFRGEHVSYTAFATQTSQAFVKDELRPDGTSGMYHLSRRGIVPNSEKVTVETRDRFRSEIILKSEPMNRGIDYEIDYTQGTLFFRNAIPGKDQNFNPLYIIADYESEDASRDERVTAGGRVGVRFADNKAELGTSAVHEGTIGARGDLIGVDASYQIDDKTKLRTEYAQSKREFAGTDLSGNAYLLEARRQDGNIGATAYLRAQDGGFGLGQQAAAQAGTTKVGGDTSVKINDQLQLNAEAYQERTDSGSAQAERTLAEARLDRTRPDYGLYGGARAVIDRTTTGETLTADQLIAGGNYRLMDGRLNARVDSALTVGGNNASTDFPHHLRLGADYTVTENMSLFADQEFAYGARENASTTRLGVKAKPWEGAESANSLNIGNTPYGLSLSTTDSLTQRLRLTDEMTLNAGVDRTSTLRKPGNVPLNPNVPSAQGEDSTGGGASQSIAPLAPGYAPTPIEDYTSIFAGASWNDGPWGAGLRGETRRGETFDRLNLSANLHRDLDEGEALAATALYTSTSGGLASSAKSLDLRLSYASRQNESRWIVLDRLDYIQEESDTMGAARNRRLVNNFNANYQHDRLTQVALQYGAKYVLQTFDAFSVSGYTDLIGAELRRDIGNRFDLGARTSLLHSWSSDNYTASYGLSLGYSPITNLWLSVGYNFAGFRDDDFSGANSTAKGWYLSFRFKFDQGETSLATRRGLMFNEAAR